MRTAFDRAFYGPPDWFARQTSVRTRRAIQFWLWAFWMGPGSILWWYLRSFLWFVGLMSLIALQWSGWIGVGTETPVEEQQD